mgnify:FL=1
MPRQPQPKYSTDPMGIPFGPGHPLFDPIKNETSPTPTLTQEQIQQMIADALAAQQGAGQQQGVASLADRISQHITSSSNPEYIQEFDTNQDGKLSTQDIIFAKQFDAGLRDPETLEAIQTQQQPDLSGFTTQEDLDAAIQSALAGQDFSGFASQADIQEAIGGIQGPDLSGYAQTGDVDTAIQQALAGQDFSQFATDADIQQALSGIQTGPDRQSIEQMIGDAIGGIQGPDLSGFASQADIQEALAGQDFSGFASQADIQDALSGIEQFDPSSLDFSQYMTAADAEELLRNMDTSGIESSVLQKMGTADMLTDERMQEAINQALGGAGILGEEDILRILSDQGGPDLSDYLKTGQAEQMFVGQEQVEQMIADGLAQGLSPEQIQAMIAEATGGEINEAMIQEMIAEAMAQAGTGGLTEEAVQAMIDATGQGASMEQIQNMLGESGYLTQDQIQAMIQESATPSFDPTGLEERLASLEAGAGSGGFDPTGLEERLAALEAAGATNTGGGATETTPYVPPDPDQYKVSTGPYGYNPYQSGQYQSDPYGPSGVPKMGGVTTLPTPDDGYTIYNPYMKQS